MWCICDSRGSVIGLGFSGISFLTKSVHVILRMLGVQNRNGLHDIRSVDLFLWFFTHRDLRHTTLHSKECTQTTTGGVMSNEVFAIIMQSSWFPHIILRVHNSKELR